MESARPPRAASCGCTISLQVNHPPGCPRLWGLVSKCLFSSHGLTHLEASIWAVGWAEATWQLPTRLRTPLQGLCHRRRAWSRPPASPCHTGAGHPAADGTRGRWPACPVWPARVRVGHAPAFSITTGPVPRACLVASRHGGFSGGWPAPSTAGVAFAAQLLPGRPMEVWAALWGEGQGGGPARSCL